MNKIIEMLTSKFAGRIVTKLVTAAAAALCAHGAMKPEQQGAWIVTNADWLTGVVLSLVSVWLSKFQHAAVQDQVATALATPAPTQNFTANINVGIANTDTTKGN